MNLVKFNEYFTYKSSEYKIFYDNENLLIDEVSYKTIILTDVNENVLGYAIEGFRTRLMKRMNVHVIGSVYGKGLGEFLYGSYNAIHGLIIPSDTVSDLAKNSWLRRYNNENWNKNLHPNLGFHNEEYLNHIYDLKPEYKKLIKNSLIKNTSEKLINDTLELYKRESEELFKNKNKYYS
jgi:hypothetical protein